MGIYNQANFSKDKLNYLGVDEPGTPWGTGAETPAKSVTTDSPHYELQRERAQPIRRRSSLHTAIRPQPLSVPQRTVYLGSRGLFLFGLGVLYGMLVAQLKDRRQAIGTFQMTGALNSAHSSYDFGGLTFWGVSAVVMGSLLPWIDGVWERIIGGTDAAVESAVDHSMGGDIAEKGPATSTDWALAVRGIGAFVGIAFAIVGPPFIRTPGARLGMSLGQHLLIMYTEKAAVGLNFTGLTYVGSREPSSLVPN